MRTRRQIQSMGSITSRQETSRPRPNKRTLSSIFICGSSSSTLPNQMEENQTEDDHDRDHPIKFPRRRKEFALTSNVIVNDNPSAESSGATSVDCRSGYGTTTSNQDKVLIHNSSSESIDDVFQETIPSILGSSVLEREGERRDGTVQNDDMTSVSSESRATSEINGRELRVGTRRLIWDAFFRENSGMHSDPQTFSFSSDDSDDDGLGDGSLDGRYVGSRIRNITERQQRLSPEIWESIRRGDGARRCPSGVHYNDTCLCDPTLMVEGGRPRASLSRIVMLAETLFEVLDEIQRHPLSLSLAMVPLPAPSSVVDLLPVKNHKVDYNSENDIEQCHICLAAYEEGVEIRVLPCQHEYHMSCVDKWLKQVHRVCPLCRGDVCEAEATVLSSGTPLD